MNSLLATHLIILHLLSISSLPFSCSKSDSINEGSSLSVEKPEDVLTSPNGIFSAGFYPVGDNAYYCAIWFNKPSCTDNCTLVWIANRDHPVNGKKSKLSLLKKGNLILTDADGFIVWSTITASTALVQLNLLDSGNLVLYETESVILWQSFDFPTDSLLPLQLFTRNTHLVSSRSQTNFSSGFYGLLFDNDNLIRLLYDGPEVSSIYWFDPWLISWNAGRSSYNNSRIAFLDALGNFSSSDDLNFRGADYGPIIWRRLTVDFDGNFRMYSLDEAADSWVVSWQAISGPCKIHGACGENSVCSYDPSLGRQCSCFPGFKMKNQSDWSYGCEQEFSVPDLNEEIDFILVKNVEFYGYDYGFFADYTLEMCKNLCLKIQDYCKGFQHRNLNGHWNCYPKTQFLNGRREPDFDGDIYLKVPKSSLLSFDESIKESTLACSGVGSVKLDRTYAKAKGNSSVQFLLWFACAVGVVEAIVIFLVWLFLIRNQKGNGAGAPGYLLAANGLKRFTYAKLKKATRNFCQEIGRGAGGVVYRGVLPDDRVVAIKRLYEANRGEAEFLTELSTIGKLNHMNLIDMYGYCAERKNRLLVYEYMEYGSLAANLISNSLDSQKRFDIALGTAKGLAYLHEECLDWVLHCDVKPQNILLDSSYRPKVSDFGLSKLLNRSSNLKNASFSRIRGTRGYMAPEWVFNMPITSKVDVYSYGMVVLEMVTGKNPAFGVQAADSNEEMEQRRLVTWVREKKTNGVNTGTDSWIEEIIDPKLEGKYDNRDMEMLVSVALQCVEEDREQRPTMSQVVEMLQGHDHQND